MCCPACIKRPLLVFIAIIILLFILAFVFCHSNKNKVKEEVAITPPIVQEEVIIEEITPEVEVEVVEEIDELDAIKKDFINNGIISNKFTKNESIFFDKSHSVASKQELNKIDKDSKDSINNARLAIISGHACDLGNKKFNDALIQKRVDFIIKNIKEKNPSIEILFSNEGQAKAPPKNINEKSKEKQRKEERRVDIYLYK